MNIHAINFYRLLCFYIASKFSIEAIFLNVFDLFTQSIVVFLMLIIVLDSSRRSYDIILSYFK
jgi:hypothetical protein